MEAAEAAGPYPSAYVLPFPTWNSPKKTEIIFSMAEMIEMCFSCRQVVDCHQCVETLRSSKAMQNTGQFFFSPYNRQQSCVQPHAPGTLKLSLFLTAVSPGRIWEKEKERKRFFVRCHGEGGGIVADERSIGNWVGAWRSEGRGAVAKAKGFNFRKQNHKSMYEEVKTK